MLVSPARFPLSQPPGPFPQTFDFSRQPPGLSIPDCCCVGIKGIPIAGEFCRAADPDYPAQRLAQSPAGNDPDPGLGIGEADIRTSNQNVAG